MNNDALSKLTYQELMELIPIVLMAGEVPFIQGNPGVGKSTFWKEVAKKFNLFFIDIRLSTYDPTMLNGFLWMKGEKAAFKLLENFPVEGDPIPINPETGKPYDGFLIHLDEFTSIPKPVEGAAYRLVLDKEVGDKHLHEKAFIACSGNPQGKGMLGKSISTPMRSRLIHFEMANRLEEFIDECIYKLDFHPLIPTFLKTNVDMFNNFEESANFVDGTYACERTWQKLSNQLKIITQNGGKIEEKHMPILTGTVGSAAAAKFAAYIKSYYASPDFGDIVANPTTAMVPEKLIEQYACIPYLVENVDMNTGAQLAQYIPRFNEECRMIFAKFMINKKEDVFDQHFKFLTHMAVKYAMAG